MTCCPSKMCFRIPNLYISAKCEVGGYDRGSGVTPSCMLLLLVLLPPVLMNLSCPVLSRPVKMCYASVA